MCFAYFALEVGSNRYEVNRADHDPISIMFDNSIHFGPLGRPLSLNPQANPLVRVVGVGPFGSLG